ncbi:MAG: gloB [Verrucomicrobiaceae bacterium]|nr:gloB [Verrucomicrobiaceae bacterium]
MLNLSYFTGGIAETNGWVFEVAGGVLLVDAPEGVADWLEQRQLRPTALLLTHQHFDHVMDAAAVKARFGCPIYAFAEYSKGLTLENLFGAATGTSLSVPAFEVDQVLGTAEQLEIAGVTFEVKHVPGHSPDSICFYLPHEGLLFGGDVLFSGSIGRTDFPGGSSRQLLEGIGTKILTLPDNTRVFPGHGPETSIGEERSDNPYLQGE